MEPPAEAEAEAEPTKQFVSQIKQLITNMFMHFISHQRRLSTCQGLSWQFYVQVLKYSIKSALDVQVRMFGVGKPSR